MGEKRCNQAPLITDFRTDSKKASLEGKHTKQYRPKYTFILTKVELRKTHSKI